MAIGADVDPKRSQVLERVCESRLKTRWLSLAGPNFDAIFSTEGIEHLENLFRSCARCVRILKPGGILVLTTPNITALRSRVRFFGSGFFGRDSRPLNESSRHPLHHIGLATFPELRYELQHVRLPVNESAPHAHQTDKLFIRDLRASMWLYTKLAFRKEKDLAQRSRNKEILATLLSASVLFGSV